MNLGHGKKSLITTDCSQKLKYKKYELGIGNHLILFRLGDFPNIVLKKNYNNNVKKRKEIFQPSNQTSPKFHLSATQQWPILTIFLNSCFHLTLLEITYATRSSFDTSLLHIPKTKTVTGDSAFHAAAPRLWNKLPRNIREAPTIHVFKSLLKTHLF